MELYLLKSASCLIVFFIFYKVLLENTSFHVFKRGYLLFVTVASFLIPLITFTTYAEVSERIAPILMTTMSERVNSDAFSIVEFGRQLLWIIYSLGVLYFSAQFLKNILIIYLKIRRNPKYRIDRIVNVLLNEKVTPHTFFNYIFLNKDGFEAQEIPSEVLLHEQTHAKQKHSIDILFIEILQIVFWFNPLIYWMKHAIKLNHEFLADQAVLEKGITPDTYQNLILTFSSNVQENNLANAIHYSFIKKRFTLMKTITSKKAIRGRLILLLPLIAMTLFGFSQRETLPIVGEEITVQESATREEMKEYTALAKKYNAQNKEERVVLLKDLERLEYIYKKMSAKQKANAEPFPECIPPPPAPKSPLDTNKAIAEIKKLAAEGAQFLLFDGGPHFKNGQIITSEKAIEIVKELNGLTIDVKDDYIHKIVEIRLKGC